MVGTDGYTGMINLAKEIINQYDKEEALKVLDNLKEWVNCGSEITAHRLEGIALNFKGDRTPVTVDYDKDVKRELLGLYAEAAKNGKYVVSLLEAGISAKRSCKTLNSLVSYTKYSQSEFDMLPYVEDSNWSDDWIKQLQFCTDYIIKHKQFGYDLMSIFTPEHSHNLFYEICYHLKDEEQYRIPLDWLKDIHWLRNPARNVLYLYMFNPERNWGVDIVKPWMCGFIPSEIFDRRKDADLDCNSIIAKWCNVSPKLGYALNEYAEDWKPDDYYEMYNDLRTRNHCDGDALAEIIYSGEYPDWVLERCDYYHQCVSADKAISVTSEQSANRANALMDAAARMAGE